MLITFNQTTAVISLGTAVQKSGLENKYDVAK